MSRLYSYCIPYDDGAAPNPFWGTCTLVICKPAIRRTAAVGDWIVGTGSQHAHVDRRTTRDLRGRMVYAMRITKKMTMQEYDAHVREHLPNKLPRWTDAERRRRLGDALYDYSGAKVVQRPGVHNSGNVTTDLSGNFALLSEHFHYFGANAIELPDEVRAIAQNRQGHRVTLNAPYQATFLDWIATKPLGINGEPLMDIFADEDATTWCAGCRKQEDDEDDEVT